MRALETEPMADLDTSVTIRRCGDDDDVLRGFSAVVSTIDEDDDETEIGSLKGWISRLPYSGIAAAGDAVSGSLGGWSTTCSTCCNSNPR